MMGVFYGDTHLSIIHSVECVNLSLQVPADIIAHGLKAKQAYRRALEQGKVSVYRGRIMIIGPERVGKTSLRKSLCGLPFNADEPSTVGVDASLCTLDIDHVKNWKLKDDDKLLGDDVIPRMLARDLKSTSDEAEIPMQEGSHDDIEDRTIAHNEEKMEEEQESASNEGVDVPDEVTKRLIKYLKEEHLDETITDKEVTISIWDFAGQHLYYASHQVFMSQQAVYVLVYNLSKDLDAKAAPRVRQGTLDILLDNPHNETNLDSTLSWLASVHNLCQDDERREYESKTERTAREDEARPYQRPGVIIVGTHADSPFEEVKEMEKKLKMGLICKSYQKHVMKPYFVVSNDNSSDGYDEGIQKLHQKIQEVFDGEPYMGKEVPVRWLHFEKAIQKLVEEKKTYFLRVEEVEKVAKEVCFIEDQDEFMTMLDFYHDLGIIIKYGATVVLNAQWLIGLFKTLITIRPYDDQTDSRYTQHWIKLEESGKLSMELVEHVLSEQLTCGQAKEDLLKMMEHFGLIVPFMPSANCYFVPSQLISSPSEVLNQCETSQGPCPLYIHFLDGFVPHGLYPQLVSKFISWCSANAGCHAVEPNLYRDASEYILDSSSRIVMTVVCCRSFIKVLLQCKSEDNSGLHGKAVEVKSFIENTLNKLSEQCPWYRCLKYKLCVRCPGCAKKPCIAHRHSSCADEKCLHLLPIIKDQSFVCRKSCGDDRWPDVAGYHYWCPEMHSAVS
ncbi:hypothetical protein QZH41_007746 [Actinostola sp. cb2023]|nr:hypothetical protein QZH41_007746 [Actinostola sp. cb2023]